MKEILLGNGRNTGTDPVTVGDRFLGEATAASIIGGTGLASVIGLTAGVVQNSAEPWLAFELDGNLLLVAKRTFRHTVSWDQINAANAVYGDRTIEINGASFKVRLLKGTNTDPTPAIVGQDLENTWGSEWNRLFYRLVPYPTNVTVHPVSQEGITYGEWASYTEEQLSISSTGGSVGRRTWCQESSESGHVLRGFPSLPTLHLNTSSPLSSVSGWRPVLELIRTTEQPRDIFLGETPVTQLITGDALANHIGLIVGTAQHSNAGWLKFLTREGRTLYVAKKPFRHSVSWNQIHAQGAVDGTRTVTLGDKVYKIRLLSGADSDPTSSGAGYGLVGTHDSEWSRLFYSVHNGVHPDSRNTTLPGHWPLYSDLDLLVHRDIGNGTYSWCQETSVGYPDRRVARGYGGVSSFTFITSSDADSRCGWRPVLELVE